MTAYRPPGAGGRSHSFLPREHGVGGGGVLSAPGAPRAPGGSNPRASLMSMASGPIQCHPRPLRGIMPSSAGRGRCGRGDPGRETEAGVTACDRPTVPARAPRGLVDESSQDVQVAELPSSRRAQPQADFRKGRDCPQVWAAPLVGAGRRSRGRGAVGANPCPLPFAAITCGHPGNPVNGLTQGNQFNLNDVVKFVCNPGYVAEGAARSQCLASGQWSDTLPTCRSKSPSSSPSPQCHCPGLPVA